MRKYLLTVIALLMISLSSCTVQRYVIGDGPVNKDEVKSVYSSDRNLYLIYGLIPLNKTNPRIPANGNYQIKTCHNVFDALISGITCGIITSRTTKILVK